MKNINIWKNIFVLLFLSLLISQCGETTGKKRGFGEGDIYPKNGHEMVDILMDKTTTRASLSEKDQVIVREIYENTFREFYGDLDTKIEPENVQKTRRTVFFESREELEKHMKIEKNQNSKE